MRHQQSGNPPGGRHGNGVTVRPGHDLFSFIIIIILSFILQNAHFLHDMHLGGSWSIQDTHQWRNKGGGQPDPLTHLWNFLNAAIETMILLS